MVSFIVNSKVWDVLLDFSRGFARYDFNVAFTLESSYSMRFYELLASQTDPIVYTIESLRKIFNLEGKYALTKDFIKYVVDAAKNELDRKSPMTFEYTCIKEGRRIDRIMFFPVRQVDKESPELFHKTTFRKYWAAAFSREEMHMLTEIGFSESGIKNNMALFLECQKQLDFLYELAMIKAKSRGKRNPCGWCINSLIGKLTDQAKKKL
jgi:plasmid replication initiation protein